MHSLARIHEVTSVIDRRAFITGVAGGFLAAPRAAGAQQAGKVYRIGFLRSGQPPETYLARIIHERMVCVEGSPSPCPLPRDGGEGSKTTPSPS